jgi:hypothetical protein
MNTMMNSALRTLTCGAAALLITVVLGLTFVQSTAVVHWASSGASAPMAKLSIRPGHRWFGQPEPAVLVD